MKTAIATKFKETEIGTIPKGWIAVNFDKILSFEYGKALKEERRIAGGIPVYGSNGVVGFHNEKLVDGPGIIVGRKGSAGEIIYSIGDFFPIDTTYFVKTTLNKKFVYYLLKNTNIKKLVGSSAVPGLNRNDVYSQETIIPAKHNEQKQIAEILSSLDDKIELNRRINASLEKLASSLFKQWFVDIGDKLPQGWRIGKLSDISDITIGRTPPRMQKQWFSENPEDIKWISIRDLGNSGIYINKTAEYLTKDAVDRFNIPVIPKNTVILSFKLTVGRVAITTEDMLSNEAIAHIKLKSSDLSSEYVYLFLKRFDYSILGSTSSIATAVNSKTIKDISILIPDEQTSKKFTKLVQPIFSNILRNTSEIDSLSQIRDSLLPRLMSGKIRT